MPPKSNKKAKHQLGVGWGNQSDIAAYLHCSEKYIKDLEELGLPCVRLTSKKILYNYQEVDDWLKKMRSRTENVVDELVDRALKDMLP